MRSIFLMDIKSSDSRWVFPLGLVGIGLLIFIWPIPHTISIRDALLLSLLGVFGYLAYRARPSFVWLRELRLPLSLYLILTLWLFIVALAISHETAWSLGEIRGQWLKGLVALSAGMLVALSVPPGTRPAKLVLMAIFLALLIHILYLDFAALETFIRHGGLPRRIGGLTEGPDRISYLANILIAILLAEILYRLGLGRRSGYLPLGRGLLIGILVLTLFSAYIIQLRNGVIPLVLMGAVFVVLYYRQNPLRMRKPVHVTISMLIVSSIALVAYVGTASDSRWRDFLDTIPVALDTETHKAWLDWDKYPKPVMSNGRQVNQSNYVRIAWFKEGSLLVLEHPLGVGFGREAFEVGLRQKYGEGRGYSHSGILDLAVGTGVPGAVLWLGFLGSLFYAAYRCFAGSGNYHSMLLMFLIADFGSRMFVDSIIRDHMLQQFLFLAGLVAVTMYIERRRGPEQDIARA